MPKLYLIYLHQDLSGIKTYRRWEVTAQLLSLHRQYILVFLHNSVIKIQSWNTYKQLIETSAWLVSNYLENSCSNGMHKITSSMNWTENTTKLYKHKSNSTQLTQQKCKSNKVNVYRSYDASKLNIKSLTTVISHPLSQYGLVLEVFAVCGFY